MIDPEIKEPTRLPAVALDPMLPIPIGAGDLVADFLDGRVATTMRAYSGDLQLFANFIGVVSPGAAAKQLFSGSSGDANRLVLAFKADLLKRGMSSSTINRRLASIRTFVKFANTVGLVPWSLSVSSVKQHKSRKTTGPDLDGVKALLKQAADQLNPLKAARDVAIIWLLFSPALRRSEVLRITTEDLDLAKKRLWILGKGRREKELITLPPGAIKAVERWLAIRGPVPGPLFVSVGKKPDITKPIAACSLYKLITTLGRACGLTVWPHALRHSGITTALNIAPVRSVQRFSRHTDLRTLMIYDDDLRDLGGGVANQVAAEIETPEKEIP